MSLNKLQEKSLELMIKGYNIFLTGPAGTGKCFQKNTPIIMYDGTVKMVQDISKGDFVMGEDSTSRTVLKTSCGKDELYKVTTRRGDSYVVNSHHILTFQITKKIIYRTDIDKFVLTWGDMSGHIKYKFFKTEEETKLYSSEIPNIVDIPVIHCLNKNRKWNSFFKGKYTSLDFPEKEVAIDPYLMGLLLGNYDARSIPKEYKINSRDVRLKVLAGLIDANKYLGKSFEIIQVYRQLANDTQFLAKSLGFRAILTYGKYNRIFISGNLSIIPVLVQPGATGKNSMVSKVTIEAIGEGLYYGFEVDGNHRFVLGNFLVTHNSHIIHTFKNLYGMTKNIAITATTGVAAVVIGGSTLHSYLGIGLGTGTVEYLANRIERNSKVRSIWSNLQVLIIDEISMMSDELFDKLEQLACKIRKRPIFGGIQLVLSGDFLQLPAVGNNKRFCFESKSWDKCVQHTIILKENMRQSDKDFQGILSDLRYGKVTERSIELLTSRIGEKLDTKFGINPTRIYTTNRSVDFINEQELNKLAHDNDFYQYDLTVEFKNKKSSVVILDEEKYKKNPLIPAQLTLCKGSQVMLLRNLDVGLGLANGSRGVITSFEGDFPIVRFLNGLEMTIGFSEWKLEENIRTVTLTQVPLKLAWAVTIHKSQGCTIDYADVNLNNVFEYGQSYVALSRVKTLDGLSITDIDFEKIQAHPKALEFYEHIEKYILL